MRIIIARYKSTCRLCSEEIRPGERIAVGKGMRAVHADCEAQGREDEDEAAGLEPGTLANDRRLAKQGLTVIRTSSGAVWTQNARGRCEDAPCCGCCS